MSKAIDLGWLRACIDDVDISALARKTPLIKAEKLSAALGRPIWLKREDMQSVFSFKIRGAANRISKLSQSERSQGICAASAGNHAQGVAAAAAYFKTRAVIFMPVTTPPIKVAAVHARGAKTRLIGDSYDDAYAAASEFARETGAVFIHPFDDIDVIAGQGTIGRELSEQAPQVGGIYVPVGGGGLISGIGAYFHDSGAQIIGCEPTGAATLAASLRAGERRKLQTVDGFADGVAVKMIGTLTFDIAQTVVSKVVMANNDQISAAVKAIFEETRTVTEPAGALAIAALIKDVHAGTAPGGDLIAIVSGANVNFDRIGNIVERAELGAGEETLFAATLPERPGAFRAFIDAVGARAITEFNYRYNDPEHAHVLVGVKIENDDERAALLTAIKLAGMAVTDLSANRMAKTHVRHLVGGQSGCAADEKIYSFEFPERPGALRDFLAALDNRWSISLFHYRNHGAASGQVLCGFQVPNGDFAALEDSLRNTGFAMSDESNNPAAILFL